MSLFNYFSDLVSKFLLKNIARGAKTKINEQFCFSSMHIHNRRVTGAYIDCCVIFQLDIWQFSKPSTMFLIQQECMQYPLDSSMMVFSLSIALRMLSSGMKYFCAKEFPKRFPELHYKMWVSLTYNYLGNLEISQNIYKEQLCYLSCSWYLITHLTRNENCVFWEVIHISENYVTSMRVVNQR